MLMFLYWSGIFGVCRVTPMFPVNDIFPASQVRPKLAASKGSLLQR